MRRIMMIENRLINFLKEDLNNMYETIELLLEDTYNRDTEKTLISLLDIINYWETHVNKLEEKPI